MRVICSVFAAFIAGATLLLAQAPNQPQPNPDPRLEQLLANWEKQMSGLSSLLAECTRKETDKAFGSTVEYTGWAKYLKSIANQPSRASLKLDRKDRKDIFEQYVFTGTYLYEFVPQQKLVRVHTLPPAKNGQVTNDNMLGFLFGMTAVEAKRRYHLTYQPPPANDKWYYYVGIKPKEVADKADFSEARLVLFNNNYMPRQLWYVQPNGNEVIWEFKVIPGAQVTANDFAPPALPPGWKLEHVARDPQPRVIRPNQ